MAMRPTDFAGAAPIDGYGPGFVRVGGVVHEGAVVISASGVSPWGGMDDAATLLALAPVKSCSHGCAKGQLDRHAGSTGSSTNSPAFCGVRKRPGR